MQQPEALRLAEMLDEEALLTGLSRREHLDYRADAAAELRRLHALNAELVEALGSIANYPELDALEMKREARAALSKAKEQ